MVDMNTLKQINKKLGFGLILLGALSSVIIASVSPSQSVKAADTLQCSVLPKEICNKAKNEATGGDIQNTGVFELLKFVLILMTAGIGIVAVGATVYAGILYSSARDSQQQVQQAKDMLKNIAIGILAYLGMFMILNWLIPGGVFG